MTTVVTTVVVRAGNAQVAVDGTRANAASRYMMIAASVLPIGKQANDAKASTPVAIATGTLLAAGQHANASFTAEDFDRVHVWTLSKVIGCFCVAFLIILAVRVLAGLVPLLSSKERQAKQSDVVRGKGGGEGGEGRTAEDMDKGKERKMLDAARNGRWEEVIHLVKNEGVDANATDFDRHLALWLECYIETMTMGQLVSENRLVAELMWLVAKLLSMLLSLSVLEDRREAAAELVAKLLLKYLSLCVLGMKLISIFLSLDGLTGKYVSVEELDDALKLAEFSDLQASQTVLHIAAMKGDSTTVTALLKEHADMEKRDRTGRTALDYAVLYRNRETEETLLKHGAHTRIKRLLRQFTQREPPMNVKRKVEALDAGDPQQRVTDETPAPAEEAAAAPAPEAAAPAAEGEPAADDAEAPSQPHPQEGEAAAAEGGEAAAQAFRGDAVNNESNELRRRKVHHAARNGNAKEVKGLLVQGRADIMAPDNYKMTPPHQAAFGGHASTEKMLLEELKHDDKERRRFIDLQTWVGWTSLHHAAFGGHSTTAQVLLEYNDDVHACDIRLRRTPLHYAAVRGDSTTVKVLLDKGAKLEACDTWGRTALHCAAVRGNSATVEVLLDRGANIQARDNKEKTASDLAASSMRAFFDARLGTGCGNQV